MTHIVQIDERCFVRLDAIESMELTPREHANVSFVDVWLVHTATQTLLSPRKYGDEVFLWWTANTNSDGEAFDARFAKDFLAAHPQKEKP